MHLLARLFGLGIEEEGVEVRASNEDGRLPNCLPLCVGDHVTIFMAYDTLHGGAGHVAGGHAYGWVALALVPSPEDFRWKVIGTLVLARKRHEVMGGGTRDLRCRLARTQGA